MQFRVRTYDPVNSVTAHLVLEAVSEGIVREQLQASGAVVLDVRPTRLAFRSFGGRGIRVRMFCIEVAALLRAGLSLPEAIASLTERGDEQASALYRRLHSGLISGLRLSDAMEASGERFPAILVAAVRAGERTSAIAAALEEYARYDEAIDALRRRAVNAAIYPAMVVAIGVLVGLFLLGYVVPRFSRIYETTAATASSATQLLLKVGTLVDGNRLAIGLALVAVIALVGWIWVQEDVRARFLSASARLPVIASLVRRYQLARITHALSMLLRGGYPLPDAMRLAGALALQPGLARGVAAALDDVREGRLISEAWVERGLGNGFDRRLLQAGERTGELGAVFDAVSRAYTRDVETAMERASRFVEPALLLVVAVLIGMIVVLMYTPIFDLAGVLQ